jgi:hypothetical protein
MFARARQLQAQREAERRAELEELEMKRFRQQSDLLRACESKQRVLAATEARSAQLDEKDAIAAQLVGVGPGGGGGLLLIPVAFCTVCRRLCMRLWVVVVGGGGLAKNG